MLRLTGKRHAPCQPIMPQQHSQIASQACPWRNAAHHVNTQIFVVFTVIALSYLHAKLCFHELEISSVA
jgi:hypothetical protein